MLLPILGLRLNAVASLVSEACTKEPCIVLRMKGSVDLPPGARGEQPFPRKTCPQEPAHEYELGHLHCYL